MNIVRYLAIFFICSWTFYAHAQSKRVNVSGYLKNMQVAVLGSSIDQTQFDNFFHNRINSTSTLFKDGFEKHLILRADLRTRLFYGQTVNQNPLYPEMLDNSENDYFDLDYVSGGENGFLLHSVLDRAYLELKLNKWEIAAGRQRINWGINSLWNPNDLFNTFNFTNFDYEEMPGSDALRVRYFRDWDESFDFAIKMFDDWDEAVLAGKYRFNYKGYDIQVLAGKYNYDLAIGAGFAGNIKNSGIKGEATYFVPTFSDSGSASLSATLSWEYSWNSGFYLSSGYLYNGQGGDQPLSQIFNFNLSPKNLYPYKHSLFVQGSYPVSPLIYTTLALIYSPGKTHSSFINPGMTYSIAQNLDMDLILQLAFEKDEVYRNAISARFMRFKWSF